MTKLKQICTKIDAHTPQNINCSSCYPFSHCYVQIVWTRVLIPVSTGMVSTFFLFHQRPNNNNKNSSWCFSHMKHHIICNGTPNKWVIPPFIGNNATSLYKPTSNLKAYNHKSYWKPYSVFLHKFTSILHFCCWRHHKCFPCFSGFFPKDLEGVLDCPILSVPAKLNRTLMRIWETYLSKITVGEMDPWIRIQDQSCKEQKIWAIEKGKSERLSIWSQKKQDPKTANFFVGFWIQIGVKESPVLHLGSSWSWSWIIILWNHTNCNFPKTCKSATTIKVENCAMKGKRKKKRRDMKQQK